jgi:hypothetical protein
VRAQHGFRDVARGLGIDFVDVHRWFCWDGECPSVIGRTIPLRDHEHVTVEYALHLTEPLAAAFGIR